jgi:hypothetical protein
MNQYASPNPARHSRFSRGLYTLFVLVITVALAACGTGESTPGEEIAPPIVITVVVTPTGGSGQLPDATLPPTTESTEPTAVPDQPTEQPTPGHPAPVQSSVSAVYQDFEHGSMVYMGDRKLIWVFIQSIAEPGSPVPTTRYGLWLGFADTFQDGEPETLPTFQPPDTFQQPKRGFGKVWRENAPVRDALGWALDFERPYTAIVVDYTIGEMYGDGTFGHLATMHAVTDINGNMIHIDESTNLWSIP